MLHLMTIHYPIVIVMIAILYPYKHCKNTFNHCNIQYSHRKSTKPTNIHTGQQITQYPLNIHAQQLHGHPISNAIQNSAWIHHIYLVSKHNCASNSTPYDLDYQPNLT